MSKRTTEEAAAYFNENNCELLSEYCDATSKLKYRCSCGEIGNTSWNNFTKGKRCGKCAKCGLCKKRSVAEVKNIFKDRGCVFLDDHFSGIHELHNYICKCGSRSQISLAGFHHQQQNCKQCGIEKNTGENNHMWIADRQQKRLNDLFRKKCYKALNSSLKATGKEKVGHTSDMLGYTPAELQEHIKNDPNWVGVKDEDWHIDHFWPIQAFVDHGINDIALINCLENLRPITQRENNIKSGKYDEKKFLKWLNK